MKPVHYLTLAAIALGTAGGYLLIGAFALLGAAVAVGAVAFFADTERS